MTARMKLVFGGLVVAGVTAYMAYVGASDSWQYYVTTDECLADEAHLVGRRLRVSGKVVSVSLQPLSGGSGGQFLLQGTGRNLLVQFPGPAPDRLAEGINVLVEGRLLSGHVLEADQVLTRCASKYVSQQATTMAHGSRASAQVETP